MKKVIVFSAKWCTNCTTQKAVLDKAGIVYEVIDVDAEMQKAKEFSVRSLPTTVILEDDVKLKTFIGAVNVAEIKELLGE